ncbi:MULTISPECIES: hypothetical protein [Acidithiobacillus]|uniref:Uncharacterized protein n=1 Tax=Acidithiobacillus thiooxidans ATCC 19377 TaxID=637390 RepID=A0A543Q224_ACITH|nr:MULTISPECIES: hypothetical protein [Acidithiobacillus]MDD5280710.1 hypothetical protein [Acidithiobacillus sp.]MDX5935511.1 hypothetical protein [Acidithiobacillus thiooxidans]TQN50348.1 hypothetical protein DLNHIDIE_00201 [Acidithiobacillus thiooxidans ATCC 19377]
MDHSHSSHEFAISIVTSILSVLPQQNWTMDISAGTPPYENDAHIPAGHIERTLIDPKHTEYTIGIIFGAKDEHGHRLRQPFDSERWTNNPEKSVVCGDCSAEFR